MLSGRKSKPEVVRCVLFLVLAAMMVGVLVAGCGGSGAPPGSSVSPPVGGSPGTPPGSDAGGGDGNGGAANQETGGWTITALFPQVQARVVPSGTESIKVVVTDKSTTTELASSVLLPASPSTTISGLIAGTVCIITATAYTNADGTGDALAVASTEAAVPTGIESLDMVMLDITWHTWGGHEYARWADRGNWEEANLAAQAAGGYLVTLSSAEEETWVSDTLCPDDPMTWIGLTDSETYSASEGSWIWTNGESVDYTHWASGQPDDAGGQDFALMECNADNLWNDTGPTGGALYWDDVAAVFERGDDGWAISISRLSEKTN